MKKDGLTDIKEKNRIGDTKIWHWLNCAKAAAIIAVLVDHTLGILYTNPEVQLASDYAVSLFIISAGITSYMSNSRSKLNWFKAYYKSVKKVVVAYLICSAICLIIKTHGFDLKVYVHQLIHFSAALPLYFVSLYLQVMLVGRFFYRILQKCPRNIKGYIWEVIVFGIVFCIASISTNYTQIMDIYAGGGKVLGGTYLILFYLGMLMAKHNVFVKVSMVKSILIWGGFSLSWLLWWKNLNPIRWIIDEMVPLGDGYDTPSITIMVFAVLTIFAIYGACEILEKIEVTRWIIQVGSWLGEHTLYIFMCHATILYFWFIPYLIIDNIWLKRVVYMGLMIIIPLGIEYGIKLFNEKVKIIVDGARMKARGR